MRAWTNALHREQCDTFDGEQELIARRLFNERDDESIFIGRKWRLNHAHYINFDAPRAAISRCRLRLDPDDRVVKGVEGLHVELAVKTEQRAWRQVILVAA